MVPNFNNICPFLLLSLLTNDEMELLVHDGAADVHYHQVLLWMLLFEKDDYTVSYSQCPTHTNIKALTAGY